MPALFRACINFLRGQRQERKKIYETRFALGAVPIISPRQMETDPSLPQKWENVEFYTH
jgi:hypothetical protein